MWESGNGIHCDFTTASEALNVAIYFIKRGPRDVQRAKCRVNIKAGNRGNGGVFTLGLGEHKPIRPKPEGVASLRFGCLVRDGFGLGVSFARHGHAKSDSFLPFADLPFPFEPSVVRVARREMVSATKPVPLRICDHYSTSKLTDERWLHPQGGTWDC